MNYPVLLTRLAVANLADVLNDQGIPLLQPVEIKTRPDSGRPFVVLGEKDEYGKEPRLILDDANMWNRDRS